MRSKRNFILCLALLALVAMSLSCEDSDVTAPAGSVITVSASPASVIIDQVDGEEQDQTTIIAQVTDGSGLPLDDLPLLFSSTGGLLTSVNNFCTTADDCSRDGEPCVLDSDCALLPPAPINTDDNGVATDILTLRLFGDPDSVTVTVKGTNIEGSAMVEKIVNLGPDDPEPVITANPPNGQRSGLPFTFDGTGSIFDPQEDPECYDWRIVSSVPVFDGPVGCGECPDPLGEPADCVSECRTRGKFTSSVDFLIGQDGQEGLEDLDLTMNVFLRVSSQEGAVCNNDEDVDESIFGPNQTSLIYEMLCDLTDPIVDAGNSQSQALDDPPAGEVTFVLTASGSDPEDSNLDYDWSCPNATEIVPAGGLAQSVTCKYENSGSFTATVTATNNCGRQDLDSVILIVTDD